MKGALAPEGSMPPFFRKLFRRALNAEASMRL
jgi:hypothetical protein